MSTETVTDTPVPLSARAFADEMEKDARWNYWVAIVFVFIAFLLIYWETQSYVLPVVLFLVLSSLYLMMNAISSLMSAGHAIIFEELREKINELKK